MIEEHNYFSKIVLKISKFILFVKYQKNSSAKFTTSQFMSQYFISIILSYSRIGKDIC